jgi:primosomal replication protein N
VLNQVVLTGQVCKSPKFKESHAGVVNGWFVIDHQSMQLEGGMSRNASIRIRVATCGEQQKQIAENFVVGDEVKVSGFLSRHESKNGQPFIAIHAQQIERLN